MALQVSNVIRYDNLELEVKINEKSRNQIIRLWKSTKSQYTIKHPTHLVQ